MPSGKFDQTIYSLEEKKELSEIITIMRQNGRTMDDFMKEMDAADLPKVAKQSILSDGGKLGWTQEPAKGSMELSLLELAFVKEFTKDFLPIQAAKRMIENDPDLVNHHKFLLDANAGFKILSRDRVKAFIVKARNQAILASQINVEYVLNTITEVIERCKQATPVLDKDGKQVLVKNGSGKKVPCYAFDAQNVLKGTELLGKYLAMWTDRKLVGNDPDNPMPAPMTVIELIDAPIRD